MPYTPLLHFDTRQSALGWWSIGRETHATGHARYDRNIKVYRFLAISFSERRGSLTQIRREKNGKKELIFLF